MSLSVRRASQKHNPNVPPVPTAYGEPLANLKVFEPPDLEVELESGQFLYLACTAGGVLDEANRLGTLLDAIREGWELENEDVAVWRVAPGPRVVALVRSTPSGVPSVTLL